MRGRLAKVLLLAAALAAFGGVAQAQPLEGGYIRGDLGWSWDGEFDTEDDGIHPWGRTEMKEGWVIDFGGGYGFMNGFRVEGEIAYRDNDLEMQP